MREKFIDKTFTTSSLAIIIAANSIISEYQAKGYRLTLRQLYYQFVARDLIPNKQSEYKRLGSIINDARLAGEIDWNAIEDGGRNLQRLSTWSNPESILAAAAAAYRVDPWLAQERYIEVWIEKEALVGVIAGVCDKWRVPYFACRGYTSQSEMYEAGTMRLFHAIEDGKSPLILHLGDHDPSGLDMTRDIRERLSANVHQSLFAYDEIDIRRLALNIDQVEEQGPPPNPAKVTDSRFSNYRARFGVNSWELDALDADYLTALIDAAIETQVDAEAYEEAVRAEQSRKERLELLSRNYTEIEAYIEDNYNA